MPTVDVSQEIQNILETNKLGDLKEFIKKRSFLDQQTFQTGTKSKSRWGNITPKITNSPL